MKKRILSLVMALVLALGLLPMSALAAIDYNDTDQIVTVEKYDEDGNGTFLLPPTRVTKKATGYGNTWVPYAVGSENVTLENDCITAYVDSSQDDGWLNNGDIVSTSKWLASVNGTCYEDTCLFYASEVKVLRIVFSPSGDGSEFQLSNAGWADLGTMAVNKDDLIELLSRYSAEDFATGSDIAETYQAALNTVLDLNATAEEVAAAQAALSTAGQVPATGITLSPQTLNLSVDGTATVTAELTPANTTDTVTWSVADSSVATVDTNGVVTGVAAGRTTLTARANDKVSAEVSITVSESAEPSTDPYVYFEYSNGEKQYMAEDGSFTLSSLDEGYFRVANTDATAWWENEEKIDAGNGSVAFHWYVNRETGAWQPSGQQPIKPITVTAGDFTQTFTINYRDISGITALKTYIDGTEVTDDNPYKVTGCVSNVAVTTKGLKDGTWIDVPVQALNYDTSDDVYYNFRFVGNKMTINRAGEATMTVSLKGEKVSTTFKAVCHEVLATDMKVVVPETVTISDWDAHGFYVGLRPDTGYTIEFEPANATNRDVTWEALTPEVANHSDLHSAGIYPIKAGTAKFLVTNTSDSTLTQEVTVTFQYKTPLTRAAVEDLTMNSGDTQALTISFTPENATEQRFTWTYSQDGVVEVSDKIETSEDGLSHWTTHQIKALKAGTVTVTGIPWDQTGGCQPVTFTVTVNPGASEPPQKDDPAQIGALMEGIASTYESTCNNSKVIIDMAAYEDFNPQTTHKTTAEAKQAYVNFVTSAVTGTAGSDTTFALSIVGLQSLGYDPQQLYPLGSSTPLDLVAELNGVTHSESAWNAPYVLAAYNQGDYGTDSYEQALLEKILASQAADGSWTEYDDSIQTTANMIMGLSFYRDQAKVQTAISKAVAYLSSQQEADGTFDPYGSGSDADACANVVMALAAAGINPDTDSRFIQNGSSALDGLLLFALDDNSGFGYKSNETLNAYATEEGFRALIAASQVMAADRAYNIYDFSGTPVSPAWETGSTTPTDPEEPTTPADPDNTITVTVSVQADTGYWLRDKSVTVSKGATVCDAFVQALEGTGITQVGAEAGYIRSITKNGVTLAEFTKGPNSGWLYTVNGELPTVSVTSYTLSDGDAILLYYTDDWTKDPNANGIDPADQAAADKVTDLIAAIGTVTKDSGDKIAAARAAYDKLTAAQKELVSNYHKLTAAEAEYAALTAPVALPFTDVTGHWALDSIRKVYDLGLMTGTKATRFSPDTALNRAMLVTILYRLEGSPAVSSASVYTDVATGAWYTDAVAWAAQHGITVGYGNGKFGPTDDITREQMATILLRYAQYKSYDTTASADLRAYNDAGDISAWALEALQWANGAGLISGRSADLLAPAGSTTRAETAVILVRFLEQIAA
ncbi:S-layer homology domain-containing protein [Evtepia sp.]|uniref:S-layer homology domain-containing protein n=1 Tax=Evtepia sp. TaxID=2773933 RepID=UPI002A840623|nr:S-layer homology domain-containing protein [Evtepia sp.]MDY4430113.1 S-layer homology domain-containing protein [Evtepia sp.]